MPLIILLIAIGFVHSFEDNNLNLSVIVTEDYLEIWARGGSLPKLFHKDMQANDELARSLILIHNRFKDSPDSDSITISVVGDMKNSDITPIIQKAKAAGFVKINLVKRERDIREELSDFLIKFHNENVADSSNQKKELKQSDSKGIDDILRVLNKVYTSLSDSSRSKQEVMNFVNSHMSNLEKIYNSYLKQKPGFSGRVILKFTITPSGNITAISIVSSTTDYPEFDKAIKNTVVAWKWKAVKGGNVTATIPFVFAE